MANQLTECFAGFLDMFHQQLQAGNREPLARLWYCHELYFVFQAELIGCLIWLDSKNSQAINVVLFYCK